MPSRQTRPFKITKTSTVIAALLSSAAMLTGVSSAANPAPNQTQSTAHPSFDAKNVATITLLGTMGGPPLDPHFKRSGNSTLLTVQGKHYLIDAGPGTVHRLIQAGVRPFQVKRIFITHNHLDHTAGLVSFMAENWFNGWFYHAPDYMNKQSGEPFVKIFGPPDTAEIFDAAMKYLAVTARIFNTDATGSGTMKMPDQVFSVQTVPHSGTFYDDGTVKVTAVENTHYGRPPPKELAEHGDLSFSYRFDTPAGAIVFTGDTGPSEAVTKLAEGADVLVTEVLDFDLLTTVSMGRDGINKAPNLPSIKHHMEDEHLSPEAIGKMAEKDHVKTVVLYHVIPGDVPIEYYPVFVAGVKKYFSGNVIMGTDLFQYSIYRRS